MSSLTRRQLLVRAAYAAPLALLTGSAAVSCQSLTLPTQPLAPTAFPAYGINTHLSFLGDSSVWANTDAAVGWLLDLGVGAVRQLLPRTTHGRAAVKKGMNALAAAGVRWCCPSLVAGDVRSLNGARRVVNEQLDWLQSNVDLELLDSLTGLNEPNSPGKAIASWVNLTRWAQQALYEETRKRPAFDHVLVQGPPLNMKGGPREVVPDVQALGGLGQWLDRGDVHIYPGDDDPELGADGLLQLLRPIHPGKPVCVSEGGYTTSLNRGYTGGSELVSEEAAALYAPKQLLVHAIAGRPFFGYELLDEAAPFEDTERSVREAGFGLIRTPTTDPDSWDAKPGFDAIRRLLLLLRGVDSSPVEAPWAHVTASVTDLRSAFWSRSDGKDVLAVWRAVDLYTWDQDARTGREVAVQPEQVNITFEGERLAVVYQPSLQDRPTNVFIGESFNLAVGGELHVVEIE